MCLLGVSQLLGLSEREIAQNTLPVTLCNESSSTV